MRFERVFEKEPICKVLLFGWKFDIEETMLVYEGCVGVG